MERRSFIQHAGIAGVLAAGIAPAVQAQAAVRWRLASSFPSRWTPSTARPNVRPYGAAAVRRQVRSVRACRAAS